MAALKVADRLHNMRTMSAMEPRKRARKARQTELIFVPLAHYLGAHSEATELAMLSALYRDDDQPHRSWHMLHLRPALVSAANLIPPFQQLLRRAQAGAGLPRVGTGVCEPIFRSWRASHARKHGQDFRDLIFQLCRADPERARQLEARLRLLHDRLS